MGENGDEAASEWVPLAPAVLHKRSGSEVLLTHYRVLDRGYAYLIRVPEDHSLHSTGGLPLLLGMEMIRQAGLAICQMGDGDTRENVLVLQQASFRWRGAPPRFIDVAVLPMEAICGFDRIRLRRGVLAEVSAHTTINLDGIAVAEGSGLITVLPGRTYRALRRRAGPSSDEVVPRARVILHGVEIGVPGSLSAVLGWPYPHPFFFDHDVDHVPGMLFAQAAIEAHTRLIGTGPTSIELTCARFAELDEPVLVRAQVELTASRTSTVFTQRDNEVAACITGS